MLVVLDMRFDSENIKAMEVLPTLFIDEMEQFPCYHTNKFLWISSQWHM